MSYMENMADQQIEQGMQMKFDAQNNLCEKITNYIKENGYTWTFEEILKEYRKSKDGYYISHTVNDVVNKFKKEMDLLY